MNDEKKTEKRSTVSKILIPLASLLFLIKCKASLLLIALFQILFHALVSFYSESVGSNLVITATVHVEKFQMNHCFMSIIFSNLFLFRNTLYKNDKEETTPNVRRQ